MNTMMMPTKPDYRDTDADALEQVKCMNLDLQMDVERGREAIAQILTAVQRLQKVQSNLEEHLATYQKAVAAVPEREDRRCWDLWEHTVTGQVYCVRMDRKTRYVTGAEGPLAAEDQDLDDVEYSDFADATLAAWVQDHREEFRPVR